MLPGSPPLARGLQRYCSSKSFSTRITPACAGTTQQLISVIHTYQDHPRLRGDYILHLTPLFIKLGSPPLARGLLVAIVACSVAVGITPACAGTTLCTIHIGGTLKDHPRLRGDYQKDLSNGMRVVGSPPLARGLLPEPGLHAGNAGITPACAGTTLKDPNTIAILHFQQIPFCLLFQTFFFKLIS